MSLQQKARGSASGTEGLTPHGSTHHNKKRTKSFSSLAATVVVGALARIIFSLVAMDYMRASPLGGGGVGGLTEPFQIATVDSSGRYWKERMYWERHGERVHEAHQVRKVRGGGGGGGSSSKRLAFLPFYLEQVPYWPVKFLMSVEDLWEGNTRLFPSFSGDGVKREYVEDEDKNETDQKTYFLRLEASASSPTSSCESAAITASTSDDKGGASSSSPRWSARFVTPYSVVSVMSTARMIESLILKKLDISNTIPTETTSSAEVAVPTPDEYVAALTHIAKSLPAEITSWLESCADTSIRFLSRSFARTMPQSVDGQSVLGGGHNHNITPSPLSILEIFMIFVDAIVIGSLLHFVSIDVTDGINEEGEGKEGAEKIATTPEKKETAVEGGGSSSTTSSLSDSSVSRSSLPTPSPTSWLLHALNPLSIFACCTMSLRVIEHAVLLAFVAVLLLGEQRRTVINNKSGCKKLLPSFLKSLLCGLLCKVPLMFVACLFLTLLVAMTPSAVVLAVPLGFHFICNDGRGRAGSYLRYFMSSALVLAASGFVAYRSSIGLAELPTTTPPDAGHQAYLWQVLLPEIAELAQASFVMGPVIVALIVGLAFCDPSFDRYGYTIGGGDGPATESSEGKGGKENKINDENQRAQSSNKDVQDYDNHLNSSRLFTPLRALLVVSILLYVIVRRYFSLIDTLFVVVVAPSAIAPHVARSMFTQSFIVVPLLMLFVSVPLQQATYTSWVVQQMANANWLYFANLIHHGGLCLFCGQFIYTSLGPSHREDNRRRELAKRRKEDKDEAGLKPK